MTARLHKGEALAFLASLPDASVDAVITDPPYSSGGMMRGDRANATADKYRGWSQNDDGSSRPPTTTFADFVGDNRDQRTHLMWSVLWLESALCVAKPGASLLAFTDWRQLPTMSDALQLAGWVWRGLLVWDKGIARPVKGRFRGHVEYVLWASCGPLPDPEENPVYLPSVYRYNPPSGDRVHVTEKPLRLMRDLMQIVRPSGTVLDPFMGSGTTGVAAVLEGRQFIGAELTEHYFEVARERVVTAERGYADDGAQMILGVEEAS